MLVVCCCCCYPSSFSSQSHSGRKSSNSWCFHSIAAYRLLLEDVQVTPIRGSRLPVPYPNGCRVACVGCVSYAAYPKWSHWSGRMNILQHQPFGVKGCRVLNHSQVTQPSTIPRNGRTETRKVPANSTIQFLGFLSPAFRFIGDVTSRLMSFLDGLQPIRCQFSASRVEIFRPWVAAMASPQKKRRTGTAPSREEVTR